MEDRHETVGDTNPFCNNRRIQEGICKYEKPKSFPARWHPENSVNSVHKGAPELFVQMHYRCLQKTISCLIKEAKIFSIFCLKFKIKRLRNIFVVPINTAGMNMYI